MCTFAQSKQFNVSGTLLSEDEKKPLEAATIHIERVKDSSLVAYTISDKDGKFVIEDEVVGDSFNLFVSYVGYQSYKRTIDLSNPTTELGNIYLKVENALEEIVLVGTTPVTFKKDTIEFNASSFKTKKDANLEDLLKKLPGIEVDADGKIKVNGKDVDKVLVNGKTFFSDDPTIATRNLTKEMVKKVQVSDTKTKAQAFAGEEGEQLTKTINFTIEEDENKGFFSRVAAGIGTDGRYEFAGMYNAFKNEKQFSLLAGGNNINSPGFGFDRGLNAGGGGNGVTTSRNMGTNFSRPLGKKAEVSGNYFYSESDTENESTVERENILPDSRFFTNSQSSSFNNTKNHRASTDFEVNIDSTFYITVEPSFGYSERENGSLRDEESFDEQNILTNKSNSSSFSNNFNRSFENEIDVTKRFGNQGSFIRLSLDNEVNANNSNSDINSTTDFYEYDDQTMQNTIVNSIVRNQKVDGDQDSDNLRFRTVYRLPITGREFYLDATYDYRKNTQKSIRYTFDFDEVTQTYNDFINEDLSSDFKYVNTTSTKSLSIAYRKDKIRSSFTTRYINRILENEDKLRTHLSGEEDFKALELSAYLRYQFSRTENLRFSYNLNNNSPSLSQLQTFEDVTNPLNIVTGNPNLEPSNNHRFNLRYRKFNYQKKIGLNASLSGSFINNQIVNKVTIDEDLVRRRTFANVDGSYNLNANMGYGKAVKIDTVKTFRYGVRFRGSLNKSINFNNEVKYASQNLLLSPNLETTFTWDEVMEISPNYTLSFTKTTFDIDNFQEQEFLTHALGIRTATYASKKIDWSNDISFNYNPNVAAGFQKSSWFWNSSLSYSMLKDNGLLTLRVYDLLKQNTNARRSASANYIQDSQSKILERYFMLNFSWKLNKMGNVKTRGRRERSRRGFHG
jgi:hypothetical protein